MTFTQAVLPLHYGNATVNPLLRFWGIVFTGRNVRIPIEHCSTRYAPHFALSGGQ
jgi:hypothetical protein